MLACVYIRLLYGLFILQPFDPHYTPVDIEKPSFNPTPRLSLLSVDMFQNLYMARTNHGNLYIEPPSIHPNIRYDSCSTLDSTGEESENERVSSVLSEISIPNAGASLDDNDALYKTCTVSESSYQPPNIQYIQHIPLLRNSQSLKDDFQDDLQGNFSSDLDYADSAYGISGGDILRDNVSDSLHFWEQSSVPLPTRSDHFPSLCADLAETNTIQLDKAYTSSESGYIQSHDTNCSSLFIEDATPNLDTSNQGVIITQPAKMPSVEQQSLEAPTTLLDDESMNSMDSSLNFYGIGEHTQMDNSEDEIDIPRLDESDTGKHHHDDGYIEHKQHSILSDHDSGLLPQPFDIDLDFVPVPSEPVRPTSINFRLTASDHAHSDLSSGYITTSCMSHDDGQNVMELLFQQKLKDVKEEFIEF